MFMPTCLNYDFAVYLFLLALAVLSYLFVTIIVLRVVFVLVFISVLMLACLIIVINVVNLYCIIMNL